MLADYVVLETRVLANTVHLHFALLLSKRINISDVYYTKIKKDILRKASG